MANHIGDGYTLPGSVKDSSGRVLFNFEFRPMLGAKRSRLSMSAIHLSAQGYDGAMVAAGMFEQATAAHLVSWSRPEPISPAAVGALEPDQFEQLYNQISMWSELKIGPATQEDETAKNLPAGSASS